MSDDRANGSSSPEDAPGPTPALVLGRGPFWLPQANGLPDVLSVVGPWTRRLTSQWEDAGRPGIYYRSVATDTLSFLADLEGLPSFASYGPITTDIGIESRPELTRLALNSDCSEARDLSAFAKLVSLGGPDRCHRGLESLVSLRQLAMPRWQSRNCERLSVLRSLRKLRFYQSAKLESLAGLEQLPELRELSVGYSRRLCDVSVLSSASLRSLEIISFRPELDLSFVTRLPNLQILRLENCPRIASLQPLSSHPTLKIASLSGTSTVLDGDMSPLLTIPNLELMGYTNRKHYSHKEDSIRAQLSKHPRDLNVD